VPFADDPEFPTLKASYRQFLSESSRFREPIKFDDDGIRAKIHQTYRLLYLRDVVLARVLDDPTFNILNSLLFFNQVDIINYVQGNERLLKAFFSSFRDESTVAKSNPDTDNHKSQVVMLLHQLVLMGKNVQLPNRLGLYRNLVERGLLHVCEWGFRQSDARVLNASTEILSLILDHDVTIVRSHALREKEVRERTLVNECIDLLSGSKDLGIKSQIADALRAMLDVGGDGPEISMASGTITKSIRYLN
jgi:protein phosphatase-4 regulatory subunit 3